MQFLALIAYKLDKNPCKLSTHLSHCHGFDHAGKNQIEMLARYVNLKKKPIKPLQFKLK